MTLERIAIDPEVMNGQPCIRGTRLTVKRVLHILAQYKDRDEILKDYPRLDDKAIKSCSVRADRRPFTLASALSPVGQRR